MMSWIFSYGFTIEFSAFANNLGTFNRWSGKIRNGTTPDISTASFVDSYRKY